MKAVISLDREPFTRFLADETGRVVMEIYCNRAAPVPDYGGMHPLVFHLAFAVQDADGARNRLTAAGAQFVDEARPAAGSILYMLRDPWGVALQICRRARPLGT